MLRTRHLAAIGLSALLLAPALVSHDVLAQDDPIAQRKAIMEDVGDATRSGVPMARGQAPFDLETARNVFAVYVDAAARMPDLFPEGTETGGDTRALPAIWENKAEFVALFEEWGAASAAGLEGTTDLASFQAALGEATQSCRTCHTDYRLPD